jgi:hypothetical protein
MSEGILQKYPNADGYMNILLSDRIKIYGEEHNEQLKPTSIYHKLVNFFNRKKLSKNPPLILLEHPDILCKFNNKEEIKNFREYGYGGINYIFLKLIQSYPSIQCVDTRIRLGYLMSVQERALLSNIEILDAFDKEKIREYLTTFINILEVFESNESYYEIDKYLHRIYTNRITKIRKTLLDFINSFGNRSMRTKTIRDKMRDIFYQCRDLSSFSVDVNIISVLLQNPEKEIHIFCGNKHLFRLYCLIKEIMNIDFELINEKGKIVKITNKKPLQRHFTNWKNIDYSL